MTNDKDILERLENKVERNLKAQRELIDFLSERLEKITKSPEPKSFVEAFYILELEKLTERIKEIERFQEITHLQYQKVIKGKAPHKCPVCEGLMYIENKEKTIGSRCNACEGKGIVWG